MDSLSLFANHPDGNQTEHLLVDGLRVGRGRDCEVRVQSAYLSTVHFIVRREGEGWAVEGQHRHSANPDGAGAVLGTYVNDEKAMGRTPVVVGDRISPVADPLAEQPVFEVGLTIAPKPAPVVQAKRAKPRWKFW